MSSLSPADNYRRIQDELPAAVELVVAAKGRAPWDVAAVIKAGARMIGQNYVQEAQKLLATLGEAAREAEWHMIGHLQRNKAKLIPGRFALVHSIDSLELAEELAKRAAAQGLRQRVLVQVNVAGEEQKSGCTPADAAPLARRIAALEALALEGLMTIAPLTDAPEVQRTTFRGLRQLRDALQQEGLWVPTLSMGMSGDFATAVEEGATAIRLGTALFGARTT